MEITNKQQAAAGYTEVDPQAYEAVLNGKPVHLYTLTNKQGLIVKISNFGARLVQVLVPDRNGQLGDVTLGYDTLDEARTNQLSSGATIGRYANRIDKGEFTLDGKTYHLSLNNVTNSLHGGTTGSVPLQAVAHIGGAGAAGPVGGGQEVQLGLGNAAPGQQL